MSTQCSFCGEAVRPDSMFCPSCGQLVGRGSAAVPPFSSAPDPSVVAEAPAPAKSVEKLPPVPLPAPRATAPEHPEPAVAKAAAATPRPATMLVLPDGRQMPLAGTLVLGRSPEQEAKGRQAQAVRLDDPERAMSRVHLVIAAGADGHTVTDPGSANGTLLERGGDRYALATGVPTTLLTGDRLLVGDAVLVLG